MSARRLILPATLAVTTLATTAFLACLNPNDESYCGDINKKERCERADHCGWDEEQGLCVNTCHENTDMAACEAIEFCEWRAGGGSGESESGGDEESCQEVIIV